MLLVFCAIIFLQELSRCESVYTTPDTWNTAAVWGVLFSGEGSINCPASVVKKETCVGEWSFGETWWWHLVDRWTAAWIQMINDRELCWSVRVSQMEWAEGVGGNHVHSVGRVETNLEGQINMKLWSLPLSPHLVYQHIKWIVLFFSQRSQISGWSDLPVNTCCGTIWQQKAEERYNIWKICRFVLFSWVIW